MRKIGRCGVIGMGLAGLACLSAQEAKKNQAAGPAQVYEGWELRVTGIERMQELKMFGQTYRPKQEGYEIAVVRVAAKRLPNVTTDRIELKGFWLVDTQGNEHKSDTLEMSHSGPGVSETVFELPFGVPIGTRFKTVRAAGLTFDLEKFEAAAKPK